MPQLADPNPADALEAAWARWLAPLGEAVPLDEAAARLADDEAIALATDTTDPVTAPVTADPDPTSPHAPTAADPAPRVHAILAALDDLAHATARATAHGTTHASARPPATDPARRLARIVHHLFTTEGFAGDTVTYDAPDNSRLDRVLARRKGLPITLAVVLIEVARRLDVALVPISFPGHFLAATADEPRIYVDPFAGGAIRGRAELERVLAARHARFGGPHPSADALAPCAPRDVLVRMSTNLMGTWLARDRPDHALRNASRRVALRPDVASLRRDRGLLRARTDDRTGAAVDLGTYLAMRPEAPDAVRVRWQLSVLFGP